MGFMASSRTTQFFYFDKILGGPDWKSAKILDFGGNVGGFLVNSGPLVEHRNYWCVDLSKAAISQGRARFPKANFVHYDRYSSEYNPEGTRTLPVPDSGQKFDVIMAFSVFTHTHRSEMLELIAQLRQMLSPTGRLAFTFTDPTYERTVSAPDVLPGTDIRKHMLMAQADDPDIVVEDTIERARNCNWCVLIDGELYVEPDDSITHQERVGKPWESYCTFFTTQYMASLFPDGEIHAPVTPEWQHCCVLKS